MWQAMCNCHLVNSVTALEWSFAIHLMRPDLASLAMLTSRHEGYTALDSVTLFRRLMDLHPRVYLSPVHTPFPDN